MSFSSDAYHQAYAVNTADAKLSLESSAAHASTDLADTLAGIGTPLPCNAMPDPAAFNTDVAVDPKGHINALSCSGPKMMFNAELAVNDANLAARALVDIGATHCYISEEYLAKTNLPAREQDNWLSLANGSKAVSKGKVVIPLDIQSYQGAVECFILPMSEHFDVILGEDWCEQTHCEISYKSYSLICRDAQGRSHKLLTQSTETDTLCPIVSAIHLESTLQQDDLLYVVNVTEGHHHCNAAQSEPVPHDTELQALLSKYKDCFPSELPAKLPPERNVYHTIPLKNNDPPPPRKSYRLSKPEVAELNSQVASLLEELASRPCCLLKSAGSTHSGSVTGKGVVICSCTGFGLGCACAARMCSGRSKTTWLAGFSLMSSKAWMTTAGTLHSFRALQHTARLTTATLGTLTSMPASATSSCLS